LHELGENKFFINHFLLSDETFWLYHHINWEISDNVPQNDNPEFRSVSLWIAHIEWNEMYWRNDWWIKMTRIVTLCTERNSGLSFCGTLSLISQLIWWYSQNVSSDSRKWLIKHLFSPSSCKKQINKQNSYLLLAVLQSVSVPGLDMHESKHFLPGQFVHSGHVVVLFTFQK
jgi:hypothetical protein